MRLELLFWLFTLVIPVGVWMAWTTPHDALAAWGAVVLEVAIWAKLRARRARRARLGR